MSETKGNLSVSVKSSDLPDREIDYEYIVRAIKSHDALLAACKKLEWSERDSFYNPRCPDCDNLKKHGHDDKCELKAAIALAEKGA